MAILPWRRKEHRRTIGLPAAQSNIDGGLDLDVRFFGANIALTPRDTRIITQTGASQGLSSQAVKIAHVVDCPLGDCDTEEQCIYNQIGKHLKAFPMVGVFCDTNFDKWLPVLPNCGHSVAEFETVAWNINDANQPTFQVFREANVPSPDCNVPVWRMVFGEGEKWTTPPTNLCGSPTGESGACCESDGTCTDGRTQSECEGGGGNFIGSGTTCGLLAGSCNEDPPGACCCEQGSICYNDAIGGPVTCWANATELQCADGGGTWQGAFTTCVGSPCGGGVNGACCLPGGTCILADDDVDCGLQGGTWLGDPSCDPNPCGGQQGACCLASGNCLEDQSSTDCGLQGGIYQGDGTVCGACEQPEACCFGASCLELPVSSCKGAGGTPMGGTCATEPCGGGAQQPPGQQAGRRE